MILNDIFSDFLQLLNKRGVKYVIVGGRAVIFEGYSRTTRDMDVFVEPMATNAQKVLEVLGDFLVLQLVLHLRILPTRKT